MEEAVIQALTGAHSGVIGGDAERPGEGNAN